MTVLKGKGTLKIFMSDFSLLDIQHHYEIVVHDYKGKVKKELIATLSSQKTFMPFVYKAFTTATSSLFKYKILHVTTSTDGSTISVERLSSESDMVLNENQATSPISTVYLPSNLSTPPIRSCRTFTSLNLPCGCMAKAFASVCGIEFIDERNLQEHWRISSWLINPLQTSRLMTSSKKCD